MVRDWAVSVTRLLPLYRPSPSLATPDFCTTPRILKGSSDNPTRGRWAGEAAREPPAPPGRAAPPCLLPPARRRCPCTLPPERTLASVRSALPGPDGRLGLAAHAEAGRDRVCSRGRVRGWHALCSLPCWHGVCMSCKSCANAVKLACITCVQRVAHSITARGAYRAGIHYIWCSTVWHATCIGWCGAIVRLGVWP